MNVKTEKESANIRVFCQKKFKTTSICLMIRRPLKSKDVTYNALLTSVLCAGSKKYSSLTQINKYMEQLYGGIFDGQIVKKGDYQILQFYIEVVNTVEENLFEKAIVFLHHIIMEPLVDSNGFSKQIVDTEKAMLHDVIVSRINNKSQYTRLKCIESMCKNEAFGIYADGYAEDLAAINEKNLWAYYKQLIRETPLEFVITGDIDQKQAEKTIHSVFTQPHDHDFEYTPSEIIYNPKTPTIVEETMNVTQVKICIGARLNAKPAGAAYYVALLYSEILGGGNNSRLFVNIREKHSLCYSIYSFVYRLKAILMIECGVDEKHSEKAIFMIKEQIESLKKGEITDNELEDAKKSLTSNFKAVSDYPAQILDFYYTQYMLDDNTGLEDMIKGIEQIQLSQVNEMAQTIYIDTIYTLKGAE